MLTTKKYYTFSDVLIKPSVSYVNSRSEVKLSSNYYEFDFLEENEYLIDWRPVPIMSSNMDTITGIELAFELVKRNWIAVLHKYVSIEDISKLFDNIDKYNNEFENKIDYRNVFISRGTSTLDRVKLEERIQKEERIKSVCIDIANGCRIEVFDYIEEIRNNLCKNKILMVGNIASVDIVYEYAIRGVDIIKVGIGQGSACTTRIKTGVGVPQISLIDEVVEYLDYNREMKKSINFKKAKICSDGGCVVVGDISKAFVAGANFVMLGGMLAGHEETPGIIDEIDGKKYKRFSGMAARESQWNGISEHGTDEGKTVMIPYKGKINDTIDDIEGGIRSACTYTNSKTIQDLKKAELILTTIQENKIFS